MFLSKLLINKIKEYLLSQKVYYFRQQKLINNVEELKLLYNKRRSRRASFINLLFFIFLREETVYKNNYNN